MEQSGGCGWWSGNYGPNNAGRAIRLTGIKLEKNQLTMEGTEKTKALEWDDYSPNG